MIDKADLLVVITPKNTVPGSLFAKVDVVYKGDIQVGTIIKVKITGISCDAKGLGLFDSISNHKPLLCFLTRVKTDVYQISFEKERNGQGFSYQPVYAEFAWLRVAEQRPGGNISGIVAIEKEVLAGIDSADSAVVDDCATWLLRLNHTYFAWYIEKQYEEKHDYPKAVRCYLTYAGMRTGANSDIAKAIALVNELSKPLPGNKPALKLTAKILLMMQEDALRRKWLMLLSENFRTIRTQDQEAINILNRTLVENSNLQIALIDSSQNWANSSSIPSFIQALPNVNIYRQYACLRTLARLTGRAIPPNYNKFMEKRSSVIAEWMSWWKHQPKKEEIQGAVY